MSRYILFTGGNSYCGCDFEEVHVFDDSVGDEELDEMLEELVFENGESYEYVETGWYEGFESEEERDHYYNELCEGNWIELDRDDYIEWCESNGEEPVNED